MPNSDALHSWRTLDACILSLAEAELWRLLEIEVKGQHRRLFIQRLFGRANKLRENRELKEYLKGAL